MTKDALTISNIILSFFIFIHLCCEFGHYIHSFFSNRKNKKQLQDAITKLDTILETKCLKDCDDKCQCKEEDDAA